jgi:hypothetical protein
MSNIKRAHKAKITFLGRRQALLQSGGNMGLDKLTGRMQVTALLYLYIIIFCNTPM